MTIVPQPNEQLSFKTPFWKLIWQEQVKN